MRRKNDRNPEEQKEKKAAEEQKKLDKKTDNKLDENFKEKLNEDLNKKINKKLNIKITKMEPGQIPQVAQIEAEIFSVPWSEQAFVNALSMEQALFYTAAAGERVAGYCGIFLAADEGEITNVAVAPAYRRNKIAEKLLHKVMAEAEDKGARRIFLEVRSSNTPAIQLYQKAGFQTAGRRKNYYRYPTEDALVMMHESADK